MNFKQKIESFKITGETRKGNVLSYVALANALSLSVYQPDSNKLVDNESWNTATRIKISCSFSPTSGMADLLEQSKILIVEGVDKESSIASITIVPLAQFTFEKLKDVLFDMCQKFDL